MAPARPPLPPALAIVGGHGAVVGGSFRAVGGENDVRLSPVRVAERLRDAGVVVLLVCSGGRMNPELFSTRATGLPYELLHHGVRAVIASAWPLDAAHAGRWLGFFLQHWDAGRPVAEATFLANMELRDNDPFGRPADYLAMLVLGDPLVTKSELPPRDHLNV